MSLNRHRTDIEQEIMTEMELLHPGIVIMGENGDVDVPSNVAWIRLSFVVVEMFAPCINNDKLETDGILSLQVFTPIGKGAGEASTLVDEARQILKSSSLTGIEFLSFGVSAGELESDWFSLLLRADYRAQD